MDAEREPEQSREQTSSRAIQIASELLPFTVHVLPRDKRPMFPVQTLPVTLAREPWRHTLRAVIESDQHLVGLLLQRPRGDDGPQAMPGEDTGPTVTQASGLFEIGTVARVHHLRRDGEQLTFIAEGLKRFRVVRWLSDSAPMRARIEYLEDQDEEDEESKAYGMALLGTLRELLHINPLYSEEVRQYLERFTPNQPSILAWLGATLSTSEGEPLQQVLEAATLKQRLERVLQLLSKELEIARLQVDIKRQVEESLGEQQRRFFLKEQLRIIQQELGIAKDDRSAEVDRFRERAQSLSFSEEAGERFEEEITKLGILETGSPEFAVTRNYLDWLTSLPWGVHSDDILDLDHARKALDAGHAGLEDVKDRIMEFIAVGKLRGSVGGSIILLVGPPGVGKTSIGHAIADALGRRFFRFSVGGMRDEAEIKGHRRTYIGALPGKFIQAMKDAGTANPVLLIDEVDKIGASYQGDPASALLEVLDPAQNNNFLDHYLDVRFDLSGTLFICTANQLDTIPGPLLDRMEVIRLSGYLAEEKLQIARSHLWPRQRQQTGLKSNQVNVTDAALKRIIDEYSREAGVRGLDKQLGRLARKAAVEIVRGARDRVSVGGKNLGEYLGKPDFHKEDWRHGVGVVTGLAWTAMGGATLCIEASRIHDGQRGLKLTGNLGEVMQESAHIAYSYVSAHGDRLGVVLDYFDQAHIHLHVPAGATPKDGPSAGITMATALLSLALARPTPRALAMTGELTLTGLVYPVGGIREKVVAARRARVKTILLPEGNRADAEMLPDYLVQGLRIEFVSTFDQVAAHVLGIDKRASASA
ncbi:MAG: endopeptidase La [Gammaproteobacteria bacterium]|nr:endopeptidase La [Gammaproteobacteria bacterium]